MSLFRNESPNLGRTTTVNETGLQGGSSTATTNSNYKPTTRHIINVAVPALAGSGGQWIYIAPFTCKVLSARFNSTVISSGAATLTVEKISADAIAPAAANGTTIINVLSSTINLQNTANTRLSVGPSTATGTAATLNPGDQLAIFTSAASTGLVGAVLQIEVQQVG